MMTEDVIHVIAINQTVGAPPLDAMNSELLHYHAVTISIVNGQFKAPLLSNQPSCIKLFLLGVWHTAAHNNMSWSLEQGCDISWHFAESQTASACASHSTC